MKIGELSEKYESGGAGIGTISSGWGDPGGKSYGTYQFSSNAGSLDEFVDWLQEKGYWFGAELAKHPLTSAEFDAAWKWLANSDNAKDFEEAQDQYVIEHYYDPAIRILRNIGYNIENHHEVMKQVVFSRAIQYGIGNIEEMWMDALDYLGYPSMSYVDGKNIDRQMIKAIYLGVCSSYEWNQSASRQALLDRFESECEDALALIPEGE